MHGLANFKNLCINIAFHVKLGKSTTQTLQLLTDAVTIIHQAVDWLSISLILSWFILTVLLIKYIYMYIFQHTVIHNTIYKSIRRQVLAYYKPSLGLLF